MAVLLDWGEPSSFVLRVPEHLSSPKPMPEIAGKDNAMQPKHQVKTIAASVLVAGMALALFPATCAADPNEELRRDMKEVNGALVRLIAVCEEASAYDNLRPVTDRAQFPQGTLFHPVAGPLTKLSSMSPLYRQYVGQMAYWGSLYGNARRRLADLANWEATEPHEGTRQEICRISKQLVYAKASYTMACAWAYCFRNLRSLVPPAVVAGFDGSTIVNPFSPDVNGDLSPASDDYKTIVSELRFWGPKIAYCERRLQELFDNAKEAAAAKARAKGVAPFLEDPRDVPAREGERWRRAVILWLENPRLVRMSEVWRRLDLLVETVRKAQEDIDPLQRAWQVNKVNLMGLRIQAAQLEIEVKQVEAQT